MDGHPGYSARSLVETYRAAREWEPDGDFVRIDWCTVLTARQWLEWFRECLEKKIQATARKSGGRKLSPEWQREMFRCAQHLSGGYFTTIHDVPREYRERLAHRIENLGDR